MPVIKRLADRPYRWKIVPAPLGEIANHEKKMPADFIGADGTSITAACRRYLAPLIRGEAAQPYRDDGLPKSLQATLPSVPRTLPEFTG
jgi:6-phosphofructokinase 1